MNREIERKFLVADDGWKPHVIETLFLRDGLIATFGGGKVRVRVASRPVGPPLAWVALKGARHGITRSEYEYEIPVAEAEAMLSEGVTSRASRRGSPVKTRSVPKAVPSDVWTRK